MPTSIIPIPKARDAADRVNQPVRIDPGETATRITNPSNITVYYKSTDTVSDTSSDGTLTQGQGLNLTTTEYLLGAERTEVQLDTAPGPANLAPYDKDSGQAGLLVPTSRGWSLGTRTPGANTAYGVLFVPSRAMNIVSMSFGVGTAATVDDSVDLGIVASDGATRLASSGATPGLANVLGRRTANLTTPLVVQPGTKYYAVFAYGAVGGVAALVPGVSYNSTPAMTMAGTTAGKADAFNASTGTITATITPTFANITTLVALFLNEG
jgi:hypothetical protein